MTSLAGPGLRSRARQRGLAMVLLASFILLAWAPWYSTAKLESAPVYTGLEESVLAPHPGPLPAGARVPNLALTVHGGAASSISTFAPFLVLVPSEDGTELYISAGGAGELGGTVFANVGIGPGHDKHSYTMTYSDTVQALVATAVGFTPNTSMSGPIHITTTLGLDTGVVDYNRAYVPASTVQTVSSVDGNLELTLVSTDTVTFNTYVAIVPSYAPPGPAPLGHRFVGSSYSVRAAGALLVTDRPMDLHMYYDETILAGADPHTLSIFAWDAFNGRWDELGGRLFYDQGYLSVATSRFTTYALMATTAWRDDFDDFSGLNFPAEVSNVTLGVQGDHRALALLSAATSGSAVSRPITPTTAIARWGHLVFTRTMSSPTTTLTVDVLGLDGTEILTDIVSGASLAEIDPVQYPTLKLRASLSSMVAGVTPALDWWQLTWKVEEYRAYLPVMMR